VAERMVNEGAVVSAGTPIVRIISSGLREAHIGIAVEQAARLKPGQRYPITLRGASVDAVLRSVRPDIDPATLTTTAVFELPAGVDGLDGEPVALSLTESVIETGGWLPVSALIEGERGLWTVLRLGEQDGNTVTLREAVEVLHVYQDQAFVRGTLADGQSVVADGIHRVTPGTPVVAVEN
jgi:multidrug efflux pump subunit AcrA (membrane-fusion protein)